MRPHVAITKCESYDPALVQEGVSRAVSLLGGISAAVKPGSKVLVKPNLLMAIEPAAGVDTHPEVVRAVIRILKEINCDIYVGDGPSVWGDHIQNLDKVYELSGVKRVCGEEGVRLVEFDKRRMRAKFPLTTWLDDCDCLVSIPKLKTHGLTLLTGAIKNLFGLVSGTYKTELHKNYFRVEDFAGILVDIYAEARPALTVVDAVVAMEGDGPATSGKLRDTGLILAGSDAVALDSVMAAIMGIAPGDVLTTVEAAKRGLGVADLKAIDIAGEKLRDITGKPILLPAGSLKRKIPRPVIELARRLIRYYPYVKHERCIRCGACIKACPKKIISLKKGRIAFDYSGCIACFCCQEVCPKSAVVTGKSLFARAIGL